MSNNVHLQKGAFKDQLQCFKITLCRNIFLFSFDARSQGGKGYKLGLVWLAVDCSYIVGGLWVVFVQKKKEKNPEQKTLNIINNNRIKN